MLQAPVFLSSLLLIPLTRGVTDQTWSQCCVATTVPGSLPNLHLGALVPGPIISLGTTREGAFR